VLASTASFTESQAGRSFSTSHASDARKQDAVAWASGSPSLDGALQNGFTHPETTLSRHSLLAPPLSRTSYYARSTNCHNGSWTHRQTRESLSCPTERTTRQPLSHHQPLLRHRQVPTARFMSTQATIQYPEARDNPEALPHSELDGCDERYIRGTAPTKEALLLTNTTLSESTDPFAPAATRRTRTTEQLATLRSFSHPTVWSVGGSPVTEGVASTSNGRGGRVTSGSNAPHYAAEFLQRHSQTDETLTHGRRLALAMNISQSGRVAEQTSPPSSPISPNSSTPSSQTSVSWKDCKWERPLDASPTKAKPTPPRKIPTIPYRVLDAPALRDDYYCSLLAYSPTLQCLAVGLGPHVYLWSEDRTTLQQKIPDSLTAPRGSSHVTSVSFSSAAGASAILAIGRGDGRITLWSPLDPDPRFDSEQPAPISYVCFRPTTQRRCSVRDPTTLVNTEELLVGDEVGNVYVYSVEWPDQDQRDLFDWHGSMTLLARISCHTQQICGIAWSPNGKLFATGGNDNNLFLFETKRILRPRPPHIHADSPAVHISDGSTKTRLTSQSEVLAITPGRQKYTFSLNAACKAITFAPWQPSLIAAGGGSNDRCIHFFHALSGVKLATIDCYAQVTSLVFNPRKREIAATFGFAQPEHPYRVAVFAWPSCRMVVGIPWWGEERALYGIEYPGLGGSLVVATSDASIKFHEVWSNADGSKGGSSVLGSPILDDELILERIDTIR
jgi:meiosis-specific APC/C activator protein AMA1